MSLWDVYRTIDMPMLPIILEMEATGVRIDTTRLARLGEIGSEQLAGLREILVTVGQTAGKPDFNPDSPVQMAWLLYDVYQLPEHPQLGRSTDQKALERPQVRHHKIVRLLREYRMLAKLLSTYILKIPRHLDPESILRSHFNPCSVRTGRYSSSNPVNLQNIPVRIKPGTPEYIANLIREIRKCFIPPPGWRWLRFDKAQVEYRILINLARDHGAIQEMLSGLDPHTATAAIALGIPYQEAATRRKAGDKLVEDYRNVCKNVNYGIAYGSSEANTYDYCQINGVGMSRQDVSRIHAAVANGKPQVMEYIQATKWQIQRDGYVDTYHGRRIFYPDVHSGIRYKVVDALRQAFNAKIQGTSADDMKLCQVAIHRHKTSSSYPIHCPQTLFIHDEADYVGPPDELAGLADAIERIAPGQVPDTDFPVPLVADCTIADSWGDAK